MVSAMGGSRHDESGSSETSPRESVLSMTNDCISELSKQFLLQFYTVMNKCPENLHRFYMEDSSLVRQDGPVAGQRAIHEKIMKLGLNDCKAVVLQLDALRSHKNSVLIQVTGEISNNGSEMRRFMQSFVLVEQTPGNFYVLNDIFRYQDEVYVDDLSLVGSRGGEDVVVGETDDVSSTGFCGERSTPGTAIQFETPASAGVAESHQQPHEEDQVNGDADDFWAEGTDVAATNALPTQQLEPELAAEPVHEEEIEDVEQQEPEEEAREEPPVVMAPVVQPPSQPAKPSSWANVLVAGGAGAKMPPPQSIVSRASTGKPPGLGGPASVPGLGQVASGPGAQVTPSSGDSRQRRGGDIQRPPAGAGNTSASAGVVGTSRGGSVTGTLADSQQIFVGNLPTHFTEAELAEFFGKFGRVLEARIQMSKTQNRSGQALPNFGFVTFDSSAVVNEVLSHKPLTLPNNHRLNVEEKKSNGAVGGGGGGGGGSGPRGGGPRGAGRGGRR